MSLHKDNNIKKGEKTDLQRLYNKYRRAGSKRAVIAEAPGQVSNKSFGWPDILGEDQHLAH